MPDDSGLRCRLRWRLAGTLLALLPGASARKFHDSRKHKHGHTFLGFCVDNGDTVTPHACLEHVTRKWPNGAVLDDLYCVAPGSGIEFTTIQSITGYCAGSPNYANHFVYRPITVPMGLTTLHTDYKRGADVDTLTSWDRVRCRDGQLFATSWHISYTPRSAPGCVPK